MWAKTSKSGFTIVELLIVIVVIAILAAITLVAYNGVTNEANNSKTTEALSDWIKVLTLYKTDNGHWPTGSQCLGDGYLYGLSGSDTTGTAQCRQTGSTGYVESATFNTMMKSYTGSSLAIPAFVTAVQDSTDWRRGLSYVYGGGGNGTSVYIDAALAGQMNSCPVVNGFTASRGAWGQNTYCSYTIGATTDT